MLLTLQLAINVIPAICVRIWVKSLQGIWIRGYPPRYRLGRGRL